jgi:glycosyltransferase 2 family protein
LKKALYWAGSALGILGLGFVGFKLYEYAGQIDLARYPAGTWVILAVLAVAYGVASFGMAAAWREVMIFLGLRLNMRWVFAVYGISQLAKYVPSNIFQFAGRQALGTAAGLPGLPLLKSVFWELASLSSAGAVFALLTLPALLPWLPVWGALLLYAAAFAIAILLGRYLFGPALARAWTWHAAFLALAGLSFVVVLAQVTGQWWGETTIVVCGAYLIAWLAGLLTPGAPAGVGVREVVLYALLHTMLSQADLITAIVLGRIVTVSGDVVFYLLAMATRPGPPLEQSDGPQPMGEER